MSFLQRLRRHAAYGVERTAICTNTHSMTYSELLRRVMSAANRLQQRQIGPDSVVAITLEDEAEHLTVSLALLTLGTAQISLATHDPELARVTLARRVGVTDVIGADACHRVDGARFIKWSQCDYSQSKTATSTVEATGAVIYLKTSGTTGDMNIIAFNEVQIGTQAERHPEYGVERLLRFASVEHNNSKRHRLYCVWAGGTNVFRPAGSFDVAAFCQCHRVTCLDISRMHAADLVCAANGNELDSIKVRTEGSSVPYDVRRDLETRVTHHLYVRYAATECGTIAMAGPGEHDADEPTGRILPGVELEIVGPGGPLPAHRPGEIRLRAPGMASGYVDSPSDTAQRFRDGWFYPGDLGTLRSDGQLIILGRKDNMIILNGLNIFPAEIERVLERHPAVNEAIAMPFPSRVHGQIPVAAVELRAGADVTQAELQDYARGHLALRAPRRILVMQKLPRNSQGKILAREIAPDFNTPVVVS